MSNDAETDGKQLNGLQLAALGVCTFIFVVVGGMLVLYESGGLKRSAPATYVASAPS